MNVGVRVRLVTFALLVVLVPAAALAQSIVGVLGIPSEIGPIERRLVNSTEQTVKGHVFRLGTIGGQRVVVGRTAAGKVNAAIVATLLIDRFNPSALFFSGTAGGLDPALHAGDIVIGASVAQHDVGMQRPDGIVRRGPRDTVTGELHPLLAPAPDALLAAARRSMPRMTLAPMKTTAGVRVPRIVEGVIVTGDVFLADAGRGEEIRKNLGAAAVEMEGGAMVQTCRQFAVPCLVVRSITDRADAQAAEGYKEFIAAASENAAALVTAIIGQLAR
jgi:adenosylhomocysteine nucleosidase